MNDVPVTSPIPHTPVMIHLPLEIQKSVVPEDLPYGYVPRIALAKISGVCTSVTEAVATLLGVYLDINPPGGRCRRRRFRISWLFCRGNKEIC